MRLLRPYSPGVHFYAKAVILLAPTPLVETFITLGEQILGKGLLLDDVELARSGTTDDGGRFSLREMLGFNPCRQFYCRRMS